MNPHLLAATAMEKPNPTQSNPAAVTLRTDAVLAGKNHRITVSENQCSLRRSLGNHSFLPSGRFRNTTTAAAAAAEEEALPLHHVSHVITRHKNSTKKKLQPWLID